MRGGERTLPSEILANPGGRRDYRVLGPDMEVGESKFRMLATLQKAIFSGLETI